MKKFKIVNSTNDKVYLKEFMSEVEARDWVRATLDLNLGWSVLKVVNN